MPSFDIASEVDIQILDNAINTVKKEISTRFDFRGSPVTVELNKKDYQIVLEVESDMKMKQLIDVLISRSMKQGIDASAFDFSFRIARFSCSTSLSRSLCVWVKK